MKKLLGIVVLGLLLSCNTVLAEGIKELNLKLLEIEKRMDECIEKKDKDLCAEFMIENTLMLEIYGNKNFAKLIESSECEIGSGTDCGATVARMMSKGIQVFSLGLELN